MLQESRRFPRATASGHARVGFHYGGQRFQDLALIALGEGGCSFAAPEPLLALMDVLERSAPLEHLVIESETLPRHPIQAKVAYTAGHSPVVVGLEFTEMPEDLREALRRLVHTMIQAQLGA